MSGQSSFQLIDHHRRGDGAKTSSEALFSNTQGSILRQMMPPTNKLVSALAREHGISEQTLYTWRRTLKAQGLPVPGNGKNAEEWSSKDRFGIVLETAGLNEAELGEHCRRKGLFIE